MNIIIVLKEMRRMVYGSKRRGQNLAEFQDEETADPFRILIGTILSHRTKDELTTVATQNLLAKYRTPEDLAHADPETVKKLIRPSGFNNMKADNVITTAKQLVDEFGSEVPDSMDGLLKLRAVGRKTANCILVYAFNKPAIPVDSHVHRVSNRLGLVSTKDPEQTEAALMDLVPRKHWLSLHALFVRFGQTVCRPHEPRCGRCSLATSCAFYNKPSSPLQGIGDVKTMGQVSGQLL